MKYMGKYYPIICYKLPLNFNIPFVCTIYYFVYVIFPFSNLKGKMLKEKNNCITHNLNINIHNIRYILVYTKYNLIT